MRSTRLTYSRAFVLSAWTASLAALQCLATCEPAIAGMYRSFSADAHLYPPPEKENYSGFVVVKFVNGTGVGIAPERASAFRTDRNDLLKDVEEANRLMKKAAASKLEHLFTRRKDKLRAEHAHAEAKVRQSLPDLSLFFTVKVHDYAGALELIAALRTNPIVETAYAAPRPVPPPTTPDLTGNQTYLLSSASNGYDVYFAWTQPGGEGSQIKLIDVEYDWYLEHEDLQMTEADILYGTRYTGFGTDHGTACVGISRSLNNGYGMRGIVNQADIKVISACDSGGNWRLADAINNAVANTAPGDVILLEQQGYSEAVGNYCPVEYYADVYSAIVNATALDRIIIEPAGNGNQDLDAPVWGGMFQRSTRDSLAIMVGAGASTDRSRCSYSCYGSRVDIQGWGDWSVATLGYGDLYGTIPADQYAAGFAGTSSGSALSAAIAASVQSYTKARWGLCLPPLVLRTNLAANGYAQTFGLAGNIGPLPNLSNSYCAVDESMRELIVSSSYGGAYPPVGTNHYPAGTILSCLVTNSPVSGGEGTQYVANGAAVLDNGFTPVSSTNITLTLTNNAVLVWEWNTQYLMQASSGDNGHVDTTNKWVGAGSNVTVTAAASNYYHFAGWTGDTQGDTNSPAMTVTMTRPVQITANFAANLQLNGTPDWWLASYGLTNDTFAGEETRDRDGDGAPAWQEYYADTIPTNKVSVLAVTGLVVETNRIGVFWKGGTNARQYLQSRVDLVSTSETWRSVFTNHPPTSATTNYLDTNATPRLFYRVGAER